MPWAFAFIPAECFKTLSLFTIPSLFLARPAVCRILAPWPGIEPVSPAMEGWSPNHWRAREVSTPSFLTSYYPSAWDLALRRGGGCGGVWLPSSVSLGLAHFLSFPPALLLSFAISSSISLFLSVSHSPLLSAHFLSAPSSLSLPTPSLYPQFSSALSYLFSSFFPRSPPQLSLPPFLPPLVWVPVRCIGWCFLLCVGDTWPLEL